MLEQCKNIVAPTFGPNALYLSDNPLKLGRELSYLSFDSMSIIAFFKICKHTLIAIYVHLCTMLNHPKFELHMNISLRS